MCGGGNFVQDHSDRMPWDHGQLRLPLNIHFLSYNSCPGDDVFQNSRILLVTKIKADFLFKFASSLTRQFWNDLKGRDNNDGVRVAEASL